jgi:hypothetical protein
MESQVYTLLKGLTPLSLLGRPGEGDLLFFSGLILCHMEDNSPMECPSPLWCVLNSFQVILLPSPLEGDLDLDFLFANRFGLLDLEVLFALAIY